MSMKQADKYPISDTDSGAQILLCIPDSYAPTHSTDSCHYQSLFYGRDLHILAWDSGYFAR